MIIVYLQKLIRIQSKILIRGNVDVEEIPVKTLAVELFVEGVIYGTKNVLVENVYSTSLLNLIHSGVITSYMAIMMILI